MPVGDLIKGARPAREGVPAPRALIREFLDRCCQNFIELHGGRRVADDRTVIGGFGRIHDQSVLVLGYHAEGARPDSPMCIPSIPSSVGDRKVIRLIQLAEKFRRPVVTFYDPPAGTGPTEIASWKQAEGFARTVLFLTTVRIPIVSVIIGPLTRDALLTFGVADRIIVVSPRTGTDSRPPLHVDEMIPLCSSSRRERVRIIRCLANAVGSALDRYRQMPSEELLVLREVKLGQIQVSPASGSCWVDARATMGA